MIERAGEVWEFIDTESAQTAVMLVVSTSMTYTDMSCASLVDLEDAAWERQQHWLPHEDDLAFVSDTCGWRRLA